MQADQPTVSRLVVEGIYTGYLLFKYALVSQLAEEAVSKAVQYRFESYVKHHKLTILKIYIIIIIET